MNTFTFNLWIELILLPIMTLISLMDYILESEKISKYSRGIKNINYYINVHSFLWNV